MDITETAEWPAAEDALVDYALSLESTDSAEAQQCAQNLVDAMAAANTAAGGTYTVPTMAMLGY